MSYSFSIRAATKAEAKQAFAAKFDEVIAHQVCHERDKAQALAAAHAFIDLVVDDATRDLVVNTNGYLSGQWEGSDVLEIRSAEFSVCAGLADRLVNPA